MGKFKEGLVELEKLFASHLDEYNTIANLGTAYELNGNDDRALQLISSGVTINPVSHFGSEWVHVNILKYKTKKLKSLKDITQLGLNYKNYKFWLSSKMLPDDKIEQLMQANAFQLHERMPFVKPKDTVVAQLIMDFADLVVKRDGVDNAVVFYEILGI